MRIALNLIGFAPGCGGVETYVVNLLAALQRIDRENEYLVLCDRPAVPALEVRGDNFTRRAVAYQRHSLRWFARAGMQRLLRVDPLVWELRTLAVDVMHHPLTVLNPAGLPFPSVLTFHDMQQEYFPQFFSALELSRRKRSYLPSVREARAVITVSGHAAGCLVEKYGIERDKIHAIHSGCAKEYRERDAAALGETAARYGIDAPFMLYPAAPWPHKNHLRLLHALHILVKEGGFDGTLLLTGAQRDGQRELAAAVERLGLSGRVRWLGYLPKEDLPHLYNLARLMVFPSLFEGFGLPVVEAMASGCPVACSRTTSLPEVGGDAALYFDPTDAFDIAACIARVWNEESLRRDMKQRGLVQAARFSWDEAARRTVELYRSCADTINLHRKKGDQ